MKLKISKWEIFCFMAAVYQPILGLIGGYVLYTEKKYSKSGKIILIFSAVWLVIQIILIMQNGSVV